MSERILTKHPDPAKQGVNIVKQKYDQVRAALIGAIQDQPGITFQALVDEVSRRLAGQFDGSVPWYVTTVKLDLEARGLVERIPGSSPQRLQLVQ